MSNFNSQGLLRSALQPFTSYYSPVTRAILLLLCVCLGFLARLAWEAVFLRPLHWLFMKEKIAAWLFALGIAMAVAGALVQMIVYGTITQPYLG